MKTLILAVVIAAGLTASIDAQTERASFESVLIKPNFSAAPARFGVQPGGKFEATNVPLSLLISAAYQIGHDFQLVGLPLWTRDARYDIIATAPAGTALGELTGDSTPSPVALMLRA